MPQRARPHFLAMCLLAGLSQLAEAAPVHYRESDSGDLPASGQLPVLALDVGTNTVSGHQAGRLSVVGSMGLFSDDRDSFSFYLAPGLVLDALEIAVSNASTPQYQGAYAAVWQLALGSVAYGGDVLQQMIINTPPGVVLSTQTPLGAGLYNLTSYGTSYSGVYDLDYQVTLKVSSVASALPEPGSMALALIALLGVLASRRRMGSGAQAAAKV